MFEQSKDIHYILEEFVKNVTHRLLSEESKEDEQERLDRERLRQYNNPKVMANRARRDRQTPEWERPLDGRTVRGLPSRLDFNRKYLDNQKALLTDTVRDLKSLLIHTANAINRNLTEQVFLDITPETVETLSLSPLEITFISRTLQEAYQDFMSQLIALTSKLSSVTDQDFNDMVKQNKVFLRKAKDRLSQFIEYIDSQNQELQILYAQMLEINNNINNLEREINRLLAKR